MKQQKELGKRNLERGTWKEKIGKRK